jgi:hypothetical protein
VIKDQWIYDPTGRKAPTLNIAVLPSLMELFGVENKEGTFFKVMALKRHFEGREIEKLSGHPMGY